MDRNEEISKELFLPPTWNMMIGGNYDRQCSESTT